MAVINGTSMLMLVDGVAIGGTKSCTLSIDVDLPDASTKDSAGWKNNMHGQRSFSGSFDGLYDPTLTYNAEEIYDKINTRDEVVLEFANIDGTGGGLVFRGNTKIKNLSMTGDNEQPATFSASFEGNGSLTKGTVASS